MIYLLRHTQTVLELSICYGRSDVALRDDFETRDLPAILAQLPKQVRTIYSSPLTRCRRLAESVASHLQLPAPQLDARLQEMDFGAWELQPWDAIFAHEQGKEWFDHYLTQRCPEGESFQDLVARARDFLEEYRGTDILVVTHAGFIRAAMVAMGQVEADRVFDLPVSFGELVALRPRLRPIMFVGTGSDVGKSVINAGFCRLFKQDGYSPAPFKAQNMSLNSYATPDELEIGRAQAVQAEACGIAAHVDMNPILLKPTTEMSSQVVLLGKPMGVNHAKDYFRGKNRDALFIEAQQALTRLGTRYSPLVMEGAGSISEMNLWSKDIVNMRMAEYAQAAVYLVADIDRGGVFASVYGSLALLPEYHRKLIKGVIINKFRGDVELFQEGRTMLEDICGVPVVGVIPYFRDIFIEQEDSVILDEYERGGRRPEALQIAVLRLRSMSNFTDFNQLMRCESIELSYTLDARELERADVIIIPGSKNTIADLQFLREQGLERVILAHHRAGKALYGICGGYQMMGEVIRDPEQIEGHSQQIEGLGIFPLSTTIKQGKVTRACSFRFLHDDIEGRGYEIHAGETLSDSPRPLCQLDNGEQDGYIQSPLCWGSYLHGIFDNQNVINTILQALGRQPEDREDYHHMKQKNYDELAHRLRALVDMDAIYASMREEGAES